VGFKPFKRLKFKKMSNTPKHYENGLKHDLIDVIASYDLNFNRGNVLKYVVRAGRKDNEIQDLEKALDYLEREIYHLTNKIDIKNF
jgi:CO dehydrogenase/acetyl-CoA synthase alpha subunit